MNSIAGIARMFELIVHHHDDYKALQARVIKNAKARAREGGASCPGAVS
jgi:hypothetical protein